MISLIVMAVVYTLIGVFVTRLMVKPEVQIQKVVEFRCPYCTIEVTGAKQLDLINHIPCINKSEEDLETMRKNAEKKKEDEYFINCTRVIYRSGMARPDWMDSDPNYEVGGTWWMIKWTLY